MSASSTSPKPDGKTSPVTPENSRVHAPAIANEIDRELVEILVRLIAPPQDVFAMVCDAVERLFLRIWRVVEWQDLMVFASSDVASAWVRGNNFTDTVISPVIVKKLGYIMDFAKAGTISPDLTMTDIVRLATGGYGFKMVRPARTGSPDRTASQSFDKKAVPTLTKFTGHDEDYFTWREATVSVLGTAQFGRFFEDSALNARHPSVSESVFYALRGAVHGGQAQSITQGMLDDKTLNLIVLWSNLEEYYNKALNLANVVLFDIQKLLNLRLTLSAITTVFILDFRNCLQQLRKNNAKLADDADTLWALLLVAIQDDHFELIRDSVF